MFLNCPLTAKEKQKTLKSILKFHFLKLVLELFVADPAVAVAVGHGEHVGDVLVRHGHGQVVHDIVEVLLHKGREFFLD